MTKVGSRLTLDFTESADQAPTGVNAALPTTQNFAMAAVMTLLGDRAWWPAEPTPTGPVPIQVEPEPALLGHRGV